MTNSYDVDHGLSQCPPGPLEPIELAPAKAPDIRVEVEPDPRGVSVGVWQGSHCIYSGAHPIPAPASPSLSSLHGFAPGACDGMKSEDYVNKVRNDDCSFPDCAAPASPVSTVEQGDGLPVGELVVTGITHQFRPTSETFDLPSGKYALYSLSALAAVTRDWKAIEAAIDEYLDGYELRLDEGCHTPTEFERFLLDDVIAGLLAEDDILALLAARPAPAAGDARAVAALAELVACDNIKKQIASMQACLLETEDDVQELDAMMTDLARRQPAAWDAARAVLAAQRQGDA